MKTSHIVISCITLCSLLSCQRGNDMEEVTFGNTDEITFTGVIDNESTRTTLTSDRKVNWDSSDEIYVNGAYFQTTPDPSDPTKATFLKKSGTVAQGTFKAYYPATIGADLTLPSTQTYAAGKFNAPMYAESTTTSLSFRNICAVLAVKVRKSDMELVRRIRVSSSNCATSGVFTIQSTDKGYKAVLTNASATASTVILDCGDGVTTSTDGTVFHIAIPAQTYKELNVSLSTDGTSYTLSKCTKKDQSITVSVNTIYPIDFNFPYIDDGVNYGNGIIINGTVWAPVNLGYRSSTVYPYGRMFQFGRKAGFAYDNAEATAAGGKMPTIVTLTSGTKKYVTKTPVDSVWYNVTKGVNVDTCIYDWYTNDSASQFAEWPMNDPDSTKGIGNPCPQGWRIPTIEQLRGLCSKEWDSTRKGRVFYGNGEYTGNSIFLPATGFRLNTDPHGYMRGEGGLGKYWSSTRYGTNVCVLEFSDSDVSKYNNIVRSDGVYIRCVKQ